MKNNSHPKFSKFKELHHQNLPFFLPNAHDAFSAKIFENLGFPAVGTTSAGIAASLGYSDGEILPYEQMLNKINEIANAVSIPVSADIEGGYENQGVTEKDIAHDIPKTGAIAINIEDGSSDGGLISMERKMEQIHLIKKYSHSFNNPIFVNARTDVYWLNVVEGKTKLNDAINRSKNYISSGADCIFVPKICDLHEIKVLVETVGVPVNILQTKELPTDVASSGVARISTGSGPFRAIARLLKEIGEELKKNDSFDTLHSGITYNAMISMIKEKPPGSF
ncbi:isocitrate lyase/phosphoenolpyruvate mutase family protein [Salibacterium salarium]|uniref:Isocitrate lyase/phosphoenolpyruvate mutase family protein n=1 Tax=Salibacterium salarium TaxID=284579 RepID=A0A428MWV3_9BACI|nr:isocitrate lyase/phosphoenolpyruvate mutase family protein [Salibacterium salarium]RSL30617.1 isocitrate lyase/phosphoenolpyruvate mutase family protein [Salibacterium salarium]